MVLGILNSNPYYAIPSFLYFFLIFIPLSYPSLYHPSSSHNSQYERYSNRSAFGERKPNEQIISKFRKETTKLE